MTSVLREQKSGYLNIKCSIIEYIPSSFFNSKKIGFVQQKRTTMSKTKIY